MACHSQMSNPSTRPQADRSGPSIKPDGGTSAAKDGRRRGECDREARIRLTRKLSDQCQYQAWIDRDHRLDRSPMPMVGLVLAMCIVLAVAAAIAAALL